MRGERNPRISEKGIVLLFIRGIGLLTWLAAGWSLSFAGDQKGREEKEIVSGSGLEVPAGEEEWPVTGRQRYGLLSNWQGSRF